MYWRCIKEVDMFSFPEIYFYGFPSPESQKF